VFSNSIFDVSIEAYLLQGIVRILPETPSKRELLIQNAKLLRMIMEPPPKDSDPLRLLGGGSVKKSKKRLGKRAQEIGHQAKKVRELTEKFFKEFLRRDRPTLTNAEYRIWKAKFDSGMKSHRERMMKEVSNRVIHELASPSRSRKRLSH
jgi:hypothetical protein